MAVPPDLNMKDRERQKDKDEQEKLALEMLDELQDAIKEGRVFIRYKKDGKTLGLTYNEREDERRKNKQPYIKSVRVIKGFGPDLITGKYQDGDRRNFATRRLSDLKK